MILLSIPEVKEFMSKLLLSETFDTFLFVEGEIVTFNTFTMNGRLQKDFFDKDMVTERTYSLWKDLRKYASPLSAENALPSVLNLCLGYLNLISKNF